VCLRSSRYFPLHICDPYGLTLSILQNVPLLTLFPDEFWCAVQLSCCGQGQFHGTYCTSRYLFSKDSQRASIVFPSIRPIMNFLLHAAQMLAHVDNLIKANIFFVIYVVRPNVTFCGFFFKIWLCIWRVVETHTCHIMLININNNVLSWLKLN
jgi:hypothetical protein